MTGICFKEFIFIYLSQIFISQEEKVKLKKSRRETEEVKFK